MPNIAAKALVENKGKYLVLKHGKEIDLPGSLIAFKESLPECLKKSVKEQTNLTVETTRPLGLWHHGKDEGFTSCVTFLCKVKGSAKLKVKDKEFSGKFMAVKDIKRLKCEPSLKKIFDSIK